MLPTKYSGPQYIVVGHIAHDLITKPGIEPGAFTPGGTALYSALTARRLGASTGVLTSITADFDRDSVEGAEVIIVPASTATVFENTYEATGRVQVLHSTASSLTASNIPESWRTASILHLGPIADEVDASIAHLFPHALKAATPQGWLRRWDQSGKVTLAPHGEIIQKLQSLDVIVVSEEDIAGDPSAIQGYKQVVRIVILTRGSQGCTIFSGGEDIHVPAVAAHEVDPTGAGDVFTTAFLLRYERDNDLYGAALFAAATASCEVEQIGPAGIPTLAAVEERLLAVAL